MDEKPITPFDELVTPSSLQLLKLLIPYIPPSQQRTFAIYVKYMELQSTIAFFQKKNQILHMQAETDKHDSFSSLLEMLLPYLGEQEQEMLSSVTNAMNMMQMFQDFQEMEAENGDECMDESSQTEEHESTKTSFDSDGS